MVKAAPAQGAAPASTSRVPRPVRILIVGLVAIGVVVLLVAIGADVRSIRAECDRAEGVMVKGSGTESLSGYVCIEKGKHPR